MPVISAVFVIAAELIVVGCTALPTNNLARWLACSKISAATMRDLTSSVAAVVVVFRQSASVVACLMESLERQTALPGEVVLVDNWGDAELDSIAHDSSLNARVIRPGGNIGYVSACNLAAASVTSEWVFFLNPDAIPDPEALKILLGAADQSTAVVGAQVLLPGGDRVNAGDNPLHVSGLSWSGRYLEAPEHGPPRDVAVASGTALLVRRADFDQIGGYNPDYFMYQDDVDLAWRARMAGRRVVLAPEAVVVHNFDFEKGDYKWFWLERNRLWTILSDYELKTILLLLPLLMIVELGIFGQSVREGWWRQKIRSWLAIAKGRHDLASWRQGVQANRVVPDAELLGSMTGNLSSPLMDAPGLLTASRAMELYRRWLIRILRVLG
jgi:GT2 family glycosyltransferase